MAQSQNPAPPGRPVKAAEEKRPHVVSFRLTNAEKAQLENEAAAAGLALNECARVKTTCAGAPAVSAPHAEPPGAFELRQQLIRVGNNMNQIARQLNQKGEYEPQELKSASHELGEIFRRILAEITFH